MNNPNPTNPGLLYDPRYNTLGKFYAALEKDLAQKKKNPAPRGPVPKPKDFQKPTPLPDPGRPATGPFVNPRFGKNPAVGR